MNDLFSKLKAAVTGATPVLRHAGMALVCLGAALLVVGYLSGWTNANAVLFVCLLLIAAGIIIHVLSVKSESRY